ncbi:hypothetical protein E2C01_006954 [Portunus trituberculatus]|uniref:Uncharacterized protein n=1 Tax=Portunus trituberculatus TaxID=210409 RepID=A0A5B7CYP9_PORTR|nr:hypothetical protein [Portunus trituberculatus]
MRTQWPPGTVEIQAPRPSDCSLSMAADSCTHRQQRWGESAPAVARPPSKGPGPPRPMPRRPPPVTRDGGKSLVFGIPTGSRRGRVRPC